MYKFFYLQINSSIPKKSEKNTNNFNIIKSLEINDLNESPENSPIFPSYLKNISSENQFSRNTRKDPTKEGCIYDYENIYTKNQQVNNDISTNITNLETNNGISEILTANNSIFYTPLKTSSNTHNNIEEVDNFQYRADFFKQLNILKEELKEIENNHININPSRRSCRQEKFLYEKNYKDLHDNLDQINLIYNKSNYNLENGNNLKNTNNKYFEIKEKKGKNSLRKIFS